MIKYQPQATKKTNFNCTFVSLALHPFFFESYDKNEIQRNEAMYSPIRFHAHFLFIIFLVKHSLLLL